ncbi:hypothetical protein BDV11DRAFT_70683 [Aspergillus similis]
MQNRALASYCRLVESGTVWPPAIHSCTCTTPSFSGSIPAPALLLYFLFFLYSIPPSQFLPLLFPSLPSSSFSCSLHPILLGSLCSVCQTLLVLSALHCYSPLVFSRVPCFCTISFF